MPIRKRDRYFYPIDWPQLSQVIRFRRAGGRCEACGRPHGRDVVSLPDGRWQCPDRGVWRGPDGKRARKPDRAVMTLAKTWRVVLATAHVDHDPGNNADENLRAWCQRCHIIHDRPHHQVQRRITYRSRYALGDFWEGRYPR